MTHSSALQQHTDDERRLRRRRINHVLASLPYLVAVPTGLAAAHVDGQLAFAVVAGAGMALMGVGIVKGLGCRPYPPRVAAVVGGSVPSMGFGMLWLQLHQPWAVPAVLAACALLCFVTRPERGHARR